MKRPRKTADVGRGITRLPERRTYRLDSAEDMAALGPHLKAWARKFKESRAWTFDGLVAPAERLARKCGARPEPRDDEDPPRRNERPARGTVAWIAQKVLDELDLARRQRELPGDFDQIAAFEAGQWFGHLLTKLDWETDALRGERDLAHNRRTAKLGGRQPLLAAEDVDRLLAAPAGKRGAQIRRLAEDAGVTSGAVRKRLTRARARRQK